MENSTKKKAAWVAIAIAAVGAFEGLRTSAYPDIVGIPTACYGETKGIRLGMKFDKTQCDEMLAKRLLEFNAGVDSCVTADLPDTRRVAFVSLSYNIGTAAFCKSTVVRRINAGDIVGGCEAILMWDHAGGKKVPGLTKRRVVERELCLKG